MLKRDGDYIIATIHDFKKNISALLAEIQRPDSDVKGILLKNRTKTVAAVVPVRPPEKKGGSIGSGALK